MDVDDTEHSKDLAMCLQVGNRCDFLFRLVNIKRHFLEHEEDLLFKDKPFILHLKSV